ncbi:FtsX-like permease family protein [Chryseobacterium balustinum]|uniref:FtsX-like permease family n=1 Tax=Chryseobacterium balustinum TaxID=246 RepID=A0AAX2IIH7_9FLAO|nr:FtsX-like permease family protein [Chryseobacterium balustinum]AZB31514.1 ABC transporter permease [Chryseobacterium balustinum]SKC09525.1 FtsX-like permease family protein [Chryseobacterium balustinum]SQA88261.1 FtsX-like permease family [Chryseobacterium balustinum]
MKKIFNSIILYAGLFIAFILVLSCLQLYENANRLFGSKSSDSNYWLTFSKKITPDNIGRKELLGFNENDISKIKTWSEVKAIYPFSANEFKASANGGDFIPFYTDLYFEGLDLKAIDSDLTDEEFQVKGDEIPIIISREYLNLYNYGFALNQGLPQISEDFAKKIEVNINITVNKQNKTYKGKMVGLSDRIHSVLIPKKFLDSLNIAEKPELATQPKIYNRVLVQVKDSGDEGLVSKMKENGYESNQESLRSAKIKSKLFLVLKIIAVLGVFIFALCLYIIVSFIKIQFLEKQEEVSIKNSLGYSPKKMVSDISRKFSINLMVVLLLSLGLIAAGQYFIANSDVSNGLLSMYINPLLWTVIIIIPILVYFFVNILIYRWLIKSWKI